MPLKLKYSNALLLATVLFVVKSEISECSEIYTERIETCAFCSRNYDNCTFSETENCVSKNCTINNNVVEFSVPTNIETCRTETVTTYNQINFTHHPNDCPTTSIYGATYCENFQNESLQFCEATSQTGKNCVIYVQNEMKSCQNFCHGFSSRCIMSFAAEHVDENLPCGGMNTMLGCQKSDAKQICVCSSYIRNNTTTLKPEYTNSNSTNYTPYYVGFLSFLIMNICCLYLSYNKKRSRTESLYLGIEDEEESLYSTHHFNLKVGHDSKHKKRWDWMRESVKKKSPRNIEHLQEENLTSRSQSSLLEYTSLVPQNARRESMPTRSGSGGMWDFISNQLSTATAIFGRSRRSTAGGLGIFFGTSAPETNELAKSTLVSQNPDLTANSLGKNDESYLERSLPDDVYIPLNSRDVFL